MNIEDYLALAAKINDDQSEDIVVDKTWSQGRTVYGGMSSALAYAAARAKVGNEYLLRNITVNFVGPLQVEKPLSIHVENVRSGKNVSQIQSRIMQDGKTCLIAQCCFGVDRTSKIRVENDLSHGMELPAKPKFIPQIPKITPKFLRYFELAIDQGSLPFSAKDTSHYYGWMRYKKAPEDFNEAHLIGLFDAWPPTVLQMLRWPTPASSISWTLNFAHPLSEVSGEEWYAYKAVTRHAQNGYSIEEANIWDSQGKLIATSQQTVAVFD